MGDVDGDGLVTAVDALLILQADAGLLTLTAEQRRRADVNGDGRVDPIDAQLIQNFIATGTPSGFACPTDEPTPTPTHRRSPCPPLGDVNGDGWVDIRDARMIDEAIAGARPSLAAASIARATTRPVNGGGDGLTLTAAQRRRADVNGDGRVDGRDSLLIRKYAAGRIDTFPNCR